MASKQTSPARAKEVFIRFVLPDVNPDSGVQEGVFRSAYALRREAEIAEHERAELDSILKWFGENLKVPTRFNRTKSKGYHYRNTKGISWFKTSATEYVSRMHRLVAILEDHGHNVTMIRSNNPGYVVYEDECQIVAEPFRDLRA